MSNAPEALTLLTLIVPVCDEEGAIAPFLARTLPILERTVKPLGPGSTFEILFVDDGSTDRTVEEILAQRRDDQRIRLLVFSRNFGKDNALSAGLAHARGSAVIPIDVDLQDPPELIPDLVERWLAGYDIVNAIRSSRSSDSFGKRTTAKLFYCLFNCIAEPRIAENAGDFRLLSRAVVDAVNQLPERARFMKGLFSWVGFQQVSVEYQREPRTTGATKWSYWRLWNFSLDGITSFTSVPLRIWTYFGALVSLSAFCFALFLIARTLINGVDVPGYASLAVLVLFFGGIQLLSLGIIGEYLGRTYTEVKARPLYIIKQSFGLGQADELRETQWTGPSMHEWPHTNTSIGGSSAVARSLRA